MVCVPAAGRTRRIVGAARGNPGLQDLLFSLQLESSAKCDQALDDMETFLAEGHEPSQDELLKFLANLAIDHLLKVLSDAERELLRFSTLFSVPVPVDVLAELARAEGLDADDRRLFALGLWERHEGPAGEPASAVNELVRPRAGTLSDNDTARIAGESVGPLFAAWGGVEGRRERPVASDVELTRLALLAGAAEVLAVTAADAVMGLEGQFAYPAAAAFGRASIEVLDEQRAEVPLVLLRKAGEVCKTTGETQVARDFYGRALARFRAAVEAKEPVDVEQYAATLIAHARLLQQDGEIDEALRGFEEAQQCLGDEAFRRSRAVTLGEIARILGQGDPRATRPLGHLE